MTLEVSLDDDPLDCAVAVAVAFPPAPPVPVPAFTLPPLPAPTAGIPREYGLETKRFAVAEAETLLSATSETVAVADPPAAAVFPVPSSSEPAFPPDALVAKLSEEGEEDALDPV